MTQPATIDAPANNGATIAQLPAAKPATPLQRLSQVLEGDEVKAKIGNSLAGLGIDPSRFVRTALSALSQNTFVVEKCSPASIVGSVMRAAALGIELDPSLGQAYIVPRGGAATLQISYRGWLRMAWNSGRLLALDVGEICDKGEVEYLRGTTPRLTIKPPLGDRGKPIAYYCAAQWKDGGSSVEVMSLDDVIKHRDLYSDEWKKKGANSVWGKHFDEMAKKTVLLLARKTWPVSLTPEGTSIDADGNTFEEGIIIDQPAREADPSDGQQEQSAQPGKVKALAIIRNRR